MFGFFFFLVFFFYFCIFCSFCINSSEHIMTVPVTTADPSVYIHVLGLKKNVLFPISSPIGSATFFFSHVFFFQSQITAGNCNFS